MSLSEPTSSSSSSSHSRRLSKRKPTAKTTASDNDDNKVDNDDDEKVQVSTTKKLRATASSAIDHHPASWDELMKISSLASVAVNHDPGVALVKTLAEACDDTKNCSSPSLDERSLILIKRLARSLINGDATGGAGEFNVWVLGKTSVIVHIPDFLERLHHNSSHPLSSTTIPSSSSSSSSLSSSSSSSLSSLSSSSLTFTDPSAIRKEVYPGDPPYRWMDFVLGRRQKRIFAMLHLPERAAKLNTKKASPPPPPSPEEGKGKGKGNILVVGGKASSSTTSSSSDVMGSVYVRGPKKGQPKPPPKFVKPPAQAMRPQLERLVTTVMNPLFSPHSFGSVLINVYRGAKVLTKKGEWTQGAGKDCIGPHRDTYGQSVNDPIVSLSFGHYRSFHIRHEETKQVLVIPLGGSGDLLVMAGTANRDCIHWIPPEPNTSSTACDDRLNLTFRPCPKK